MLVGALERTNVAFIFCSIYRQQGGMLSKETRDVDVGLEILPAELT